MAEEAYRKWDIIIKALAPMLTILGLVLGSIQFAREQNNLRTRELNLVAKNDAIEFKRRIWERQLSSYMNTARAVAEVVTTTDQPKLFKAAVDRFYTLYWGNMILFEDDRVRQQMILFNVEVQDFRKGLSTANRLRIRAGHLQEALRASSHDSWTQLSVSSKPG